MGIDDATATPSGAKGGRAGDWVVLRAIYVGGPLDTTTEEIAAGPDPGDPHGRVRAFGFDFWPEGRRLGPIGRYVPAHGD